MGWRSVSVFVNGEEVHGWEKWSLLLWSAAFVIPLLVAIVALLFWLGASLIPVALLVGCVWLLVVMLTRILPNIALRDKD